MAFDLLWQFDAKTKKKQNKTKQKIKNKTKTKIVCLVFFNILGVIKGHLGSRDLLFL